MFVAHDVYTEIIFECCEIKNLLSVIHFPLIETICFTDDVVTQSRAVSTPPEAAEQQKQKHQTLRFSQEYMKCCWFDSSKNC